MLPLETLVVEYQEVGMVFAVLIGFGFGFVLERAGFGNAGKLAAQFYLHDMTVFKVMFAAIVTAMLGVTIADGAGLISLAALSESAVSFTYLWPMLVGGLVLGAGFIISGYCPGTSIVGIASGHKDAVFTYLGVIIGSVAYGELYPLISEFHNSSNKGFFFLHDLLRIPPAVLAVIIAVMAVGMFIGAEKVEKIFTAKRKGESDIPQSSDAKRPRVYALATIFGFAAIALGTLALPSEPAAAIKHKEQMISQTELARRILDEPWSVRILDVRQRAECAKSRIPGAECAPLATLKDLGLQYDPGARDIVVVDWQTKPVPPPVTKYSGSVFVLEDGFMGWKKYALTKPELPGADSTAAEKEAYTFRAALHSAMTGRKPAPPPPASGKVVPRPKKKKGGGCS